MISPITGEQIANYGTWAQDFRNKQNNNDEEDDDEGDDIDDDPVLLKLKNQLKLRGANGILGLSRLFRIMDDDGSKSLSFAEFRKAMKDLQLSLSDAEVIAMFKKFGMFTYLDNYIQFNRCHQKQLHLLR